MKMVIRCALIYAKKLWIKSVKALKLRQMDIIKMQLIYLYVHILAPMNIVK